MRDQERKMGSEKNYKTSKKRPAVLLALLLILTAVFTSITACGNTDAGSDTALEETELRLFYLNQEGTSITAKTYTPYEGAEDSAKDVSQMETEDYISDMLRQLSESDEVQYQAPLRDIEILSRNLVDGNVTIDLSEEYDKLENIEQILVRAALVETLCQLDDVDSVTLLLEGEPLLDASGNEVGAMEPDDFISSSGSEIQTYERERLHLYFADESGTKLVDTYRNVVFNSNISMERLVVEQVIKGPNSDVVYPTVNPDTKVISVTTRDGVCYVNLDDTFLDDPYNVTGQVAIYSIVNALTQLSSVRKVQFSINGETNVSFMENMKFQTLYEFNEDIVEGSGQDENT